MLLRATISQLAIALQESMMASDIRSGLSNAIRSATKGADGHQDHYHGYVDHSGDEDSGDVIYSCNPYGEGSCTYTSVPYSKGTDSSDSDYSLDLGSAKQVALNHSWDEVSDDADGYAAMESANLYTEGTIPLCERFVSKAERKSAPSGSFAGKGKSFPILKAADVGAALHSLGRAGADNYSTETIKSNIKRIAKEKGFPLPKSLQDGGDSAKESKRIAGEGDLQLVESSPFPVDIELREAFSPGKMIKLISVGKGTSAWYTEAALKKAAADGIFHAGLPMRIDHPTHAEQAARPEGSVKDWGAVLAENAGWLDSYIDKDGKDKGKGLYAPIKPFSDHAQTIEEKGPFAGVSIMANGNALVESGKPVMRDGVPVLKEFTSAQGADMVTRAGAGGMFLSESARTIQTQEVSVTEAEAKVLIESAVSAATAPLRERAVRGDAREQATRLLAGISLPPIAKTRIIEASLGKMPLKDGALDSAKFSEVVVAEAKAEGEYLSALGGGQRIQGMGIAPAVQAPKPEELAARETARKAEEESMITVYESMGMPHSAAIHAAKGRAA